MIAKQICLWHLNQRMHKMCQSFLKTSEPNEWVYYESAVTISTKHPIRIARSSLNEDYLINSSAIRNTLENFLIVI